MYYLFLKFGSFRMVRENPIKKSIESLISIHTQTLLLGRCRSKVYRNTVNLGETLPQSLILMESKYLFFPFLDQN